MARNARDRAAAEAARNAMSEEVIRVGFSWVLVAYIPNPLPDIDAATEFTLDIAVMSIGMVVYLADLMMPLRLLSSLSPLVTCASLTVASSNLKTGTNLIESAGRNAYL